ncbi:hypothetical protein [Legionella maceachernii]|uniref:Uncharacterized protein n=1 Tax=Legionella maceachernii TaxID=466 RepID=A0A0W0WFQ9_9GAMM|nr:hypothetical protein [Legionella maceachernii]KTD31102.1 hypothetical protein Lmac_0405 [Legionella maceachernii]SJZ98818.1 hypothetical protein SAMN02745128_01673 [Legionella maceachernii]SUP01191.1 Uncharacterised protein [Legionella maceachernii]
MALEFETIRENQNKLNHFIERWKNELVLVNLNLQPEYEEIVKQLSSLSPSSTWFNHQTRLDQFKLHIKSYVQFLKNPNLSPTKRNHYNAMLYLLLVAVPKVLENSLAYLEHHEPLRAAGLPAVLQFQHLVDSTLDGLISRREKVFTLKLSDLRVDYERVYVLKHGSGLFGFFKLPIKRYFRQDSRTEELKFIEDIDFYLQQEGGVLSAENKEKLKLSALNLVRFKIRTESHGSGSQLKRLIEMRLRNVGLQDNHEIITDFIDFCERIPIEVPSGLEACFRNDLRAVAYN